MTSTRTNNQVGIFSRFDWVANIYDQSGVWLDKVVAGTAAKQRPGHQGVAAERVPTVELFLEWLLASGTLELAIERLLGFGFWCQRVFVTLDKFPGDLGIELLKNRHDRRVS